MIQLQLIEWTNLNWLYTIRFETIQYKIPSEQKAAIFNFFLKFQSFIKKIEFNSGQNSNGDSAR